MVMPEPRERRRWRVGALGVAVVASLAAGCAPATSGDEPPPTTPGAAPAGLVAPTFHHIHINSVDPQRSLAWYQRYWPQGTVTTYAGFPAFYDDIYLLYTEVDAPAPGGFDRALQRSDPQSGFWTFGSTFAGPNTEAFRARIADVDHDDASITKLLVLGLQRIHPDLLGKDLIGQLEIGVHIVLSL